jgi:hypothetical protein
MNANSHTMKAVTPGDSRRFRLGLIPATILFFVAFVTAAYGAMIIPNILRDASNGFDARYLTIFAFFPASLFGVAICCIVAGRAMVLGKWRNASIAVIPGIAFIMLVGLYIIMLR